MLTANALPRHDTFQSDDTFSISLYVRNLDTADVAVAFRERSVRRPRSCKSNRRHPDRRPRLALH
jgi:hypothetical protein